MDRKELDLQFSVSATNRKPRPGEVDGVNYHFLSDQQFNDLIAEGAFVEYGTGISRALLWDPPQ